MPRSRLISLIGIILVGIGALAGTLIAGNSPQLGLDLQGGASVVLQPREKVSSDVIDQAIEIVRNRVDALGVAEPDITRQGDSIIVELPGVRNKDRALEVVGQTAQLFFRPVLAELPPEAEADATTTTTAAPGATTTTAAPGATTTTTSTPGATTTPTTAVGGGTTPTTTPTAPAELNPTTPPEENDPTKEVILPELDEKKENVARRYQLGPAEVSGQALSSASASVSNEGGWQVDFGLTSDGEKAWNEMARKVGVGGRVAIDLDGVVQLAPSLQTTEFGGGGQITGGYGEREAKDLALVLRYGSLPVQLDRQTVQTVSASLGKESLRAGLVAGFIGLGLVALYMVLYYRALGVVVWLGLLLSGAIMYSFVTFMGETRGLALTLAGATGIIVSVGVTVDSYVVYFERLKDEIRAGKTIRSSVDRGFSRAYRTILAADAASFIGAIVLYVLSVGSVRGFAFFLAASTVLDVIVAYMFTRPMVVLLGRSRFFTEAKWFGVARGLASTAPEGRA